MVYALWVIVSLLTYDLARALGIQRWLSYVDTQRNRFRNNLRINILYDICRCCNVIICSYGIPWYMQNPEKHISAL